MAKRGKTLSLLAGAALALLSMLLMPAPVRADPPPTDGWTSDPAFTITLLGRDGPNNTDHYLVTLSWGGTFFGVASESMPLVPADQAVNIVLDGYKRTFPGRPPEDIQPDDSFDFFVPAGTLVATQWRILGNVTQYRSLQGDTLTTYTDPKSSLLYRLVRGNNPNKAEIKINQMADLTPDRLAQAIYGQGDPNFKPDFLQLTRAKGLIQANADTAMIDLTKEHLDDLQELKGSAQSGGKTDDGMDVYWFGAGEQAQPLFRIDDAVGDQTDLSGMPSLIRVYYYKDGTVRTYQRASDTVLLSGRQPQNDAWAKVYQDYKKVDPAPARWEIGQPEQDDQAQELNKLGIAVLRFQPKPQPQGNFFTQLLDMLMGLMKRKEQ